MGITLGSDPSPLISCFYHTSPLSVHDIIFLQPLMLKIIKLLQTLFHNHNYYMEGPLQKAGRQKQIFGSRNIYELFMTKKSSN